MIISIKYLVWNLRDLKIIMHIRDQDDLSSEITFVFDTVKRMYVSVKPA